jgi:hypothetical protein
MTVIASSDGSAHFNESSWELQKSSPRIYHLPIASICGSEIDSGGSWNKFVGAVGICPCCNQWLINSSSISMSPERAANAFKVLHDVRGLSVHFMLDLDGTIYQTLDLKERAWHATTSNSRSVGIEMANIGAYRPDNRKTLEEWVPSGPDGKVSIVIPERPGRIGDPHSWLCWPPGPTERSSATSGSATRPI